MAKNTIYLCYDKDIGSIEVGDCRGYFTAKKMKHDSPLKHHELAEWMRQVISKA